MRGQLSDRFMNINHRVARLSSRTLIREIEMKTIKDKTRTRVIEAKTTEIRQGVEDTKEEVVKREPKINILNKRETLKGKNNNSSLTLNLSNLSTNLRVHPRTKLKATVEVALEVKTIHSQEGDRKGEVPPLSKEAAEVKQAWVVVTETTIKSQIMIETTSIRQRIHFKDRM